MKTRAVAVLGLLVALVASMGLSLTPAEARSGSGGAAYRTQPVRLAISLNSVGSRYVNAAIPIVGYLSGNNSHVQKRIVLQRWNGHRWINRSTRYRRALGKYTMPSQRVSKPGIARFRTLVYAKGHLRGRSRQIALRVISRTPPQSATCASNPSPTTCAKPADLIQTQVVDDQAQCNQLIVTTANQQRTQGWVWSTTAKKWVPAEPSAWTTVSQGEPRAAAAADCMNVVDTPPADALLPDIRVKSLDKCGTGDMLATDGKCFLIDPSAPLNDDFPALEGKKLLKFPVIGLNVGAGPSEIIADRSADSPNDWKAYQTFYRPDGSTQSVYEPKVKFYYARDGHNHWHVQDFDSYQLLDSTGEVVARAEKHGYCLQDNTSYRQLQGQAGVPTAPVYLETTSCGKGLPNALTIIHGLSRGWGDTYPTSLPDQAVDITGLPDGDYTAQIHADDVGAVTESNEDNNVASMKINITGNTVTPYPGTAAGGLD
jgi:hypothetical protein